MRTVPKPITPNFGMTGTPYERLAYSASIIAERVTSYDEAKVRSEHVFEDWIIGQCNVAASPLSDSSSAGRPISRTPVSNSSHAA